MTEFIIFFLLTILALIVSAKKKLLPNFSGENHQLFLKQKNVPLIGGILIFFPIVYFFYNFNPTSAIFFFLILITGVLSDLRILKSPKIRFLLQIFLIFFSVYILDIYILETRIKLFDYLLDKKIFSISFAIFCLMVLINGSNFIDGLNGLLFGYVIIILLIIYKLNLFSLLDLNNDTISFLFYCFFLLIIFNFLNLLYLGDGGSYILGFFLGYLLILIYNSSNNISPFFIILLLWYPCFENLFSILRKKILNHSPIIADNNHFHQLVFYFLRKKLFKNNLLSNNFSSILINLYNLIIIFIGSFYPHNTKLQVVLILFNILIYLCFYFYLFNFRIGKK